ncbi:MAG: hypothetical protein HYY24_01215 [Verrucomicrobia bacterium]|nr:hypothetical protein [Verrucomicrobiota bacterium]
MTQTRPVEESLADLERAARELQQQDLRRVAKRRLGKAREAVDRLRAAFENTPDSKKVVARGNAAAPPAHAGFDPEAAGRQLVEQMQAAEGGAWTGAELQARFGLTPAVLHRRRKEHRVVHWRDARHEFHYPQWQFTPAGALLPGVQEVLQTLHSDDEWRVMSYFLGQRRQLSDRRPLDLLREGEKEKVLEHARVQAQENTW